MATKNISWVKAVTAAMSVFAKFQVYSADGVLSAEEILDMATDFCKACGLKTEIKVTPINLDVDSE